MRYHVSTTCSVHKDRFDCPDALIHHNQKFDEYGIIVQDGGSSVIEIRFCPWCGTELPPSKREAWHAEVARRGLDPNANDLPEDLRDDDWWRTDTSSNPTVDRGHPPAE